MDVVFEINVSGISLTVITIIGLKEAYASGTLCSLTDCCGLFVSDNIDSFETEVLRVG